MSFLHHLSQRLLAFLLPARCPLCQQNVQDAHCLCPTCFSKMHFIPQSVCHICGRPMPFPTPWEQTCPSCLKQRPRYMKMRSAFFYNDETKPLILALKHGDKLDLIPLLEHLCQRIEACIFTECDIFMPVPLHQRRLIKRGYNQVAQITQYLARRYQKTYDPLSLVRIKKTVSQGHLSPQQRKQNMQRAFAVKNADRLKGKQILLVDDVITTGATINACTRALLRAGVKGVFVISLARVIR